MWEETEQWYFPELTREQAKTILQGAENGTFLVRVSSTADRPGPVLSVSYFNNGVQRTMHFTIEQLSDGHFTVANVPFANLHEILLHYRSNPLTDDGFLRLTNPADVKYFAKNDWCGSEELANKVALAQRETNHSLMPVTCGQILRLIKRNPLTTPVLVEDGADAKLWFMGNDQGQEGLVPSTCLLVYVRSEYESFMQRQRQLETNNATKENTAKPDLGILSSATIPVQTPPPSLPVSRPLTMSNPFSSRRLGLMSDSTPGGPSIVPTGKLLAADKFELPSQFPAKAVAILDRNPNFYDSAQLRFRKGDILTVSKPVATPTHGVDDSLAYGWSEAFVDGTDRKGLIPLFSAYIKWL